MNQRLLSEKQKLDFLFSQLEAFDGADEIKAHWARYLCVLVSGFIENAIRVLLNSYVDDRSHPRVANYVANHIKGIANLNQEKILKTLGAFDKTWRIQLEERITEEQKDAVDSIVANRHLIVHGRSVGITPVRIKNYYEKVLEVAKSIEAICV